jgi:hypothetical protein
MAMFEHEYDFYGVEVDLIGLGATPEEAASLIQILHEGGWGQPWGSQVDGLDDEYLVHKLAWYREFHQQCPWLGERG